LPRTIRGMTAEGGPLDHSGSVPLTISLRALQVIGHGGKSWRGIPSAFAFAIRMFIRSNAFSISSAVRRRPSTCYSKDIFGSGPYFQSGSFPLAISLTGTAISNAGFFALLNDLVERNTQPLGLLNRSSHRFSGLEQPLPDDAHFLSALLRRSSRRGGRVSRLVLSQF
jgi:hypothetical protein